MKFLLFLVLFYGVKNHVAFAHDGRVIGGVPAGPEDFPFYALLNNTDMNPRSRCGGSFIKYNFVLTVSVLVILLTVTSRTKCNF